MNTQANIQHARIVTKTPRKDNPDIVDITTDSYHEKLNGREFEVQQSINTTRKNLAVDVVACLREITAGDTAEMTIKIIVNKQTHEPERIVKTWQTKKEYYGR